MSQRTVFDALFSTKENEKLYYETGILVEVCEELYRLMDKNGYKNKDIAKKLNVSPSQVSQWLSGSTNMQLKTVADILFAMDLKFQTFEAVPIIEETLITAEDALGDSISDWENEFKRLDNEFTYVNNQSFLDMAA